MKIGFIGMGKLGLPVAVGIAYKGHDIVGFDINPKINSTKHPRELLFTKEKHFDGTGSIDELLETSTLRIVDTIRECIVHGKDIIFLAIQTPHQKQFEGNKPIPQKERSDFDYTYLVQCMNEINLILEDIKQTRIVTIISTVLPGTVRRLILPSLSSYCQLCYNPFFIAMGSVLYDFYNPEFILLGRIHPEAEKKLKSFYHTIAAESPIFCTSVENAELIKVSYNTFITSKLVLVNNIMEICHHLPNTNVDEVMNALKLGTRRIISTAYLNGGMGDGGGCHPRDNIAMSWLNDQLHIDEDYFSFIMRKREKQTEFLVNIIQEQRVRTSLPICILGKAFKPNTNLVEGSPALLLASLMEKEGIEFEHYDPLIDTSQSFNLEKKLYFVACSHSIFLSYNFPSGSCVIDPHRYLIQQQGVELIQVGVGPTIT